MGNGDNLIIIYKSGNDICIDESSTETISEDIDTLIHDSLDYTDFICDISNLNLSDLLRNKKIIVIKGEIIQPDSIRTQYVF